MAPARPIEIGLAIALLAAPLAGCVSTEEAGPDVAPLQVEDLVAARVPSDAPARIPFEPRFEQGDVVLVTASGVGPFLQADDGRHHATLRLTVQDASDGERVHTSVQNLSFDRRTMPSFRNPWRTGSVDPGDYRITVEVVDLVVAEEPRSTRASTTVTLVETLDRSPTSLDARGWGFFYEHDSGRERLSVSSRIPHDAALLVGVMDVGPFQENEEGKAVGEVDVIVRNASGERVEKVHQGFREEPPADGVFARRWATVLGPSSLDPGDYTAEITVRDHVADASFDFTRSFGVLEPQGSQG